MPSYKLFLQENSTHFILTLRKKYSFEKAVDVIISKSLVTCIGVYWIVPSPNKVHFLAPSSEFEFTSNSVTAALSF